jgi:hypothetical protein
VFLDFVSESGILLQIFRKGLSGFAAYETFIGEIVLGLPRDDTFFPGLSSRLSESE